MIRQYVGAAYEVSELLTKRYSTSFSLSSSLFGTAIRPHIYAIYGLVRIADEIVDTYRGKDARWQLDSLEKQIYADLESGYSTNPVIQAFIDTAQKYGIGKDLIAPFFKSMRTDLRKKTFTQDEYERYIYGSAEVVGLMCLKVFTNDSERYHQLETGARALGSAYQKVNFLRDIKEDYRDLGRVYFPGVDYRRFSNKQKDAIVADIRQDFSLAEPAIADLPDNSRAAVNMSYEYYFKLLQKLEKASAQDIKRRRLRLPNWFKLLLYIKARGRQSLLRK